MHAHSRRYFRSFDWISVGIVVILSIIGLLFVCSTTYQPDRPYSLFFKKQLFGIISGYILCLITCSIDYRRLQRWGYFLFIVTIGLLVFTTIRGTIGLGARRWIYLWHFGFQPSELIKLFFPAFFTYYLRDEQESYLRARIILPLISMVGISILLIRSQPDLGTAIVITLSSSILFYAIGIPSKIFIITALTFLCSFPIVWKHLKPYQQQRILVFLGQGDSRKERYQIEQSCIAIGSGGLFGKGLLNGTQNILQFLPESRTDFIFSIICEEWGFIGALGILLLYLILFIRLLMHIYFMHDPCLQMLSLGLIIHIIISTVINIGMVTGLLPIVGIPLPFMSYGITNLWISFMSLGFFMGILMQYNNSILSASKPIH